MRGFFWLNIDNDAFFLYNNKDKMAVIVKNNMKIYT